MREFVDTSDLNQNENDVVTAAQMKDIEKEAAEGGISYYQMMENAGSGAADCISLEPGIEGKKVLIFCGKGNNGGDGFVVARKLFEQGVEVNVILLEGEPKTEDAITNWNRCESMGIPLYDIAENEIDLTAFGESADIIVDAVYGTGFRGGLEGRVKAAAKWINDSEAKVYALDIPSGLNGDSGEADPDAILADETIVFHRWKPAHRMHSGKQYCGDMRCISIGI